MNINEMMKTLNSVLTTEQKLSLQRLINQNLSPEQFIQSIQGLGINFERLTQPSKHHIKVGANEKCPCGSGIKYKKCCRLTKSRD